MTTSILRFSYSPYLLSLSIKLKHRIELSIKYYLDSLSLRDRISIKYYLLSLSIKLSYSYYRAYYRLLYSRLYSLYRIQSSKSTVFYFLLILFSVIVFSSFFSGCFDEAYNFKASYSSVEKSSSLQPAHKKLSERSYQ